MKPMKSLQEIWERELSYAQEPEFWQAFAVETRCCAEFLLRKYENAIHGNEKDDDFRAFFGYKFVRMMYGYALENIIKGLLLSGQQKEQYITEAKISFGKNGHNLIWLLGELGVQVEEKEAFYLKAWSVSAEWFGKYPFPLSMNRVLPEYQSLASSEALLKRSMRGKRDFTHNDLLHQQIGDSERQCFEHCFDTVQGMYET